MIDEVAYQTILQIRRDVMYPDKDLDFVRLKEDADGLHLGFYEEGVPICIISLFLNGRELQFRKFATLVDYQHKGYGTKVLRWVLDYARDMKFDRVWANARVDAIDFYKKLGFQETEGRFSKHGHEFVVIEKR